MNFEIFWVGIFGSVGVLTRYLIEIFFEKREWNNVFPFSIFLINILGSLLAGYAYRSVKVALPDWYIPILVGFLGGFTTFSSYSLKTLLMFQDGLSLKALAYFLLSPIVGLFFCLLGIRLSQ